MRVHYSSNQIKINRADHTAHNTKKYEKVSKYFSSSFVISLRDGASINRNGQFKNP